MVMVSIAFSAVVVAVDVGVFLTLDNFAAAARRS
jgi:hypothetical protein